MKFGTILTQQADAPVSLLVTKIFPNASEMADATTTSPAPTGSASRGGADMGWQPNPPVERPGPR